VDLTICPKCDKKHRRFESNRRICKKCHDAQRAIFRMDNRKRITKDKQLCRSKATRKLTFCIKCEQIRMQFRAYHNVCLKCHNKDKRKKWHEWAAIPGNLEKHTKRTLQFFKDHPEKSLHYVHRRLARLHNAEGEHTIEQWQTLCRLQGYKCAKCKQKVPLEKDHVQPLSKGGSNYIWNLQGLCKHCNRTKSATYARYIHPRMYMEMILGS
jgi:hypothetical protein